MSQWRVTVTYEAQIEAPDADTARTWGEEEVEQGLWSIITTDVERIKNVGNGE